MDINILSLFLITTFVVVLSPGPAAISVSATAASNGFKQAMLVVAGIAIANTVYFVLSATGISALLLASNTVFTIIKWVGVAYLLYLAYQAIFTQSGGFTITPGSQTHNLAHRVFLRGFILEMANPKALLYFAALLPQFIDPTYPVIFQFIVFGAITLTIDFSVYAVYALLGVFSAKASLRPSIVQAINKTAGGMLIFAGIKMAAVQNP